MGEGGMRWVGEQPLHSSCTSRCQASGAKVPASQCTPRCLNWPLSTVHSPPAAAPEHALPTATHHVVLHQAVQRELGLIIHVNLHGLHTI